MNKIYNTDTVPTFTQCSKCSFWGQYQAEDPNHTLVEIINIHLSAVADENESRDEFGLSGVRGEFRIIFDIINHTITPRLEIFIESMFLLTEFKEFFTWLEGAYLQHNNEPQEYIDKLLELGFIDTTKRFRR